MSTDELKIIRELEKDVERDLEEEIKDGIYRLAFKLHRLYQHQMERYEGESSRLYKKEQLHAKNKILSELNINIRMESGTKIEIKETKNGTAQVSPKLSMSSASVTKRIAPPRKQKFNWESTLRSEPLCNKNENSTTPKSAKKRLERATGSISRVMAH